MKVKKLTIKNIGILKDSVIPIDKPLIVFYGSIRSGKSTHLNAIRWCCGGSYPEDIITHGADEAFIELEVETGSIRREWYRGRDSAIKDRPIIFIRDGKPVKKPVDEIKKMLNPFLLDQDFLVKKGETERKKYFTELFGVDTAEIDTEMQKCEADARDLRSKIKGYGEIDVTEVKQTEESILKNQLKEIKDKHEEDVKSVTQKNREISNHNLSVAQYHTALTTICSQIEDIKQQLNIAEEKRKNIEEWIKTHPNLTEIALPEPLDTSQLETQIAEASANNVRYEQYQKNLARLKQKKADEKELADIEAQQRKLKKDKIAKLAKISETCGVKGLSFDESGNFIYDGTSAGMLSTSQIIQLSSDLSSLYPEGLGIELLDRMESMGWASIEGLESVSLYISRAEKEQKTIIATVVGENLSDMPEKVGVFILKNGKVISSEEPPTISLFPEEGE